MVSLWTREETKPILRRKKTVEMVTPGRRGRGRPKPRWMDCVKRDIRSIGTTKDDSMTDGTGWRRNVSAAAIPQLSGSD